MRFLCFRLIGKLLLVLIISVSAICQAEPVPTTQIVGLHTQNKKETDFYNEALRNDLKTLQLEYVIRKRDLKHKHTQEIIGIYSNRWSVISTQAAPESAKEVSKQMELQLKDRIAAENNTLDMSLERGTIELQKAYEQMNAKIKARQKAEVNSLKEMQSKETNELKEKHQAEHHRMQEQQSVDSANLNHLLKNAERDYNARKAGLEREVTNKLYARLHEFMNTSRGFLNTSHSRQRDALNEKHNIERRILKYKHDMEWYGGVDRVPSIMDEQSLVSEVVAEKNDSSMASGSPASDEVNQANILSRNIASAMKTIPSEPEYLYDTESFKGAVSTVWTTLSHKALGQRNPQDVYNEFYVSASEYRSLAELELIYAERLMAQGKLDSAQQHVENSKHFVKLSNLSNESAIQVFNDGVESATILAEGIYDGSKASVIYGSQMAGKMGLLPPVAVNAIDGLYMTLDYAIDVSDTGQADANKNLVKDLAIKALISGVPVESLGGKTLSDTIANDTTKIVGQSGIYGLLDEVIQSPQAKEQIMRFLAESSAVIVKEGAKAGAGEAWDTNERIVDQMLSEMRSGLQSAKSIN